MRKKFLVVHDGFGPRADSQHVVEAYTVNVSARCVLEFKDVNNNVVRAFNTGAWSSVQEITEDDKQLSMIENP